MSLNASSILCWGESMHVLNITHTLPAPRNVPQQAKVETFHCEEYKAMYEDYFNYTKQQKDYSIIHNIVHKNSAHKPPFCCKI